MWPWEHAALGYLGYSLYRHARGREPPGDRAALAVVVAALAPDLVDKPLSWAAGVFPTGYAVGHSVFTWIALIGLVLALRGPRSYGIGTPVIVGYGSHLVGDVVYPILFGHGLALRRVAWPLVAMTPYEERLGLVARALYYLRRHLPLAVDGALGGALAAELAFLAGVAALWVADGTPGLCWPRAVRSTDGRCEPVDGRE